MLPAADSSGAGLARSGALAGLALLVTLGHLWLAAEVLPDQLGDGAAAQRLSRMDVAFVRELAPALPPAVAATPARAQPAAAPAPAKAASQPEAKAKAKADAKREPEPPPPADPAQPQPTAPVVVTAVSVPDLPLPLPVPSPYPSPSPSPIPPEVQSSAAVSAAASASSATAFEWPPSTRLSYRVSGNYRGPVEGQARVEWLRSGTRYQVHMDLGIGPSFAPLVSRRVSSEGEITPDGLYPLHYDEETRALMSKPRRVQVTLATDSVRLANGSELPRPAGVQDSASQFVHLTWLFSTQPEKLQPGQSIEVPLALPRRMEVWTYDVLAQETLQTPFGPVPTVHVKPRRQARPGTDMVAEVWFAPSLQYLPVRILIRQDDETFVDLLIERLPQQAAPYSAADPPQPGKKP